MRLVLNRAGGHANALILVCVYYALNGRTGHAFPQTYSVFLTNAGGMRGECRDAWLVRPLELPCTCIHLSKPFKSNGLTTSAKLIVDRIGTAVQAPYSCVLK